MEIFLKRPVSLVVLELLLFLIHFTAQDQSVSEIVRSGYEFIPVDASHLPVLILPVEKQLHCIAECNKRIACRTFDYDPTTKQCRLWDVDAITTGSIALSPSKPQSVVGSILFSPTLYSNIHNQSCDRCAQSRYEICNPNTSRCQCPLLTFWNGSICLAQLFRNQTCSMVDACRSDLNLTCQPSCDMTYRCSDLPVLGVGQTVAGFCNSTYGNDANALRGPWGMSISPVDGTLYVSDWDLHKYQAYPLFSRTGSVIRSVGTQNAVDIFADSSDTIYMVAGMSQNKTVYVQRGGTDIGTIPPSVLSATFSCAPNAVWSAYGIALDKSNNIYLSQYSCNGVMKWSLNATTGTYIAGQPGSSGSTSQKLSNVRLLHFDEDRNALYVSDSGNDRIQKFTIGGNGTGVTVAGNGSPGVGLNQLNDPSGIWVTRDGQTLYIADYGNHRVMKWTAGATQGSVVVGNAHGTSGSTSQLLNYPADVALDADERYLYVSDYGNHRVQRFRIQ